MANFAQIEVTFTGGAALGAKFTPRFVNTGLSLDLNKEWTVHTVRSSSGQVTQEIVTEPQTSRFYEAVNTDIQNDPAFSSRFTVTQTSTSSFRIRANDYGWTFTVIDFDAGLNASFVITNEVLPAKNFQLTDYSFVAAGASQCSFVFVSLTQNGDGVAPFTWVNPPNQSGSQTPDLSTTIARAATVQTTSIIIEDFEGDQASISNVVIPPEFLASYISDISVVTNQSGLDATATVFMDTASGNLTYEYSLDGSNFQTSNIFSSLVDGSYTLYIKDQYDCLKQTNFTVDVSASIQKPDPIVVVPKANSIRLRQVSVEKYQTLENTNYQNEYYYGEWKKPWAQLYQVNDGLITTQFRTNYETATASYVDTDGNTQGTLTVNQVSNNQGLFDSRDCIAYNKGNNQTGIYFTEGNIYDDLGTPTGTYSLNGSLPEWGKVGNTLILSNGIAGSYVIKQVVLDSTVGAYVLVIDYSWQATEQSLTIKADVTYDRKDYEVYEFDFDTNITEGIYRLALVFSDPAENYPDVGYLSENICIKTWHIPSSFIEYSVSRYTGIDYTTGYKGKLRVMSHDPYNNIQPGAEETIYTDSLEENTKLKSVGYLNCTYFIQDVNRTMLEKLNLVFTHEVVKVNGEQLTATENIEAEYFNHSSLYNLSVSLRRNNYEQYGTNPFDIDEGGRIEVNEGYLLR